ncbi:MAG: hypothetical protein V7765_15460 [Oleispira sp.]
MIKLVRLIGLGLTILALTGCKFLLPKSYSDGEAEFAQKNYQAAVTQFEAAAVEKPDNADITSALLKANAYRADQLMLQVDSLSAQDHDKRIELLTEAFSHCRTSASMFHDLLLLKPFKKDKDQPIPLVQEVFPDDVEILEYVEQVYFYSKTMPSMAKEIAALLQAEKNKRNTVLAGVNAALKMRHLKRSGPIKAYEAFAAYDSYSPFMAKVANARQAIALTLINYYEARGLYEISKNDYKQARKNFDDSLKVMPGNRRGLAGILAITIKKNLNKTLYEKAFSDLESLYGIHPESKFYKKYNTSTRTHVVKRGLAKAQGLLKSPSFNNEKEAFVIFHALMPIAKPEVTLLNSVTKANAELQGNIAKKLVSRADRLYKNNPYNYAGIIATLLNSAVAMSSKEALQHQQKASHAKKMSSLKLTLPVTFLAKSAALKKPSASESFYIWLNEEVMKVLKEDNNRDIHFVEPEDYPTEISEQSLLAAKLATVEHHEVVMLLEINNHTFIKSGEDKARQKSSVYVAERYMIHNIAKDQALLELENARELYKETKRHAEDAKRECKARAAQLGGGLLGDIVGSAACNIVTDAIHSTLTGLTDAKNTYYSTPEKIEKIRTERYKYDEYKIKVKGSIKADLFAYDIRNKKRHKLESIVLTTEKMGIRRSNVKGSDTKGIKGGDENVPDLIAIEEQVEKKLLADSTDKIMEFLQGHYTQRFCQQAQQLKKNNKPLASAETFVQCADSNKQGNENHVLAHRNISDYVGYHADFIKLYGENSHENFINLKGVAVSDTDRDELIESFLSSMSAI